jgi:hypothetical protein
MRKNDGNGLELPLDVSVLDHACAEPGQLRIAIFCQHDVLAVSVLRWLTIANVTTTREHELSVLRDEPTWDALIVFADDYPALDVISGTRLVLKNKRIRRIVLVTGTSRELDLLERSEDAEDRLVILPQPSSGMDLLELMFSVAARLTVEACRGAESSFRNRCVK